MKKTIFYNTNPVAISTRLNEYMKSNFGYEVESDLESLREAKVALEAQKREMRADHQDRAYVENMLMLETIKSLLKAHVAEVAEGKLPPALQAYQDKKNGKKTKDAKEEKVDEKAKPDFADIDGDGDKKEPMKKAAKDAKKKKVDEAQERPYVCVHAKKGTHECTATSSYGAAQKAAAHWKLKSTAGIDAHLADVKKVAESVNEDREISVDNFRGAKAAEAAMISHIAATHDADGFEEVHEKLAKMFQQAADMFYDENPKAMQLYKQAINLEKKHGLDESLNEAEKRWKQTSLSAAEAEKEYGKENVKVKKGALRNGDDMVEVFVEGKYKSDAQRKAVHAAKAEKANEGETPKFDTMKKYSNTYEAPKEYKMKKEKLEEGLMAQLNALLEADAADAEITMAARGIVDELQDMIEKLGKIQNDQLGPLADEMAYSHGPEQSAAFKEATDSAIAGLLGQARSTKDAVNDAVLVLTGQQPTSDMAATGAELGGDMGDDMEDDISMDMELSGGDESMSGPEDEPLGRAKR